MDTTDICLAFPGIGTFVFCLDESIKESLAGDRLSSSLKCYAT